MNSCEIGMLQCVKKTAGKKMFRTEQRYNVAVWDN